MFIGMMPLMVDQPEAGAAITESGAKYRNAFLVGREHHRIAIRRGTSQMVAHLPNKLAGRMGARLELVRDFAASRITNPQLILINIRVIDAIDAETAQDIVAHDDVAFVM